MLWLFAAWLMLGAGSVSADEVKFTATAKPVVTAGERFQLNYKINAEGANFRGPNITDFQMLSGPNTSTSSSVQIINGKVSRTSEYVFSYILQATADGTFSIPPATIVVDNKTYTSNSVQVKVIKKCCCSARQRSTKECRCHCRRRRPFPACTYQQQHALSGRTGSYHL